MAGLAQMQPHLPGPVAAVVLVVPGHDQLFDRLIAQHPRGRLPPARLVVRRRGEFATQLGKLDTNRLDPELLPVPIDEFDDQRCGRSSSAAKKTDAAFKISFARRNSRTSARNFRRSADS